MNTLSRTQVVFGAVVILAAIAMAAYTAEGTPLTNPKQWGLMVGIEVLRAALVLSNVNIRKYDSRKGAAVLAMSVVVTAIIALSHYQAAEIDAQGEAILDREFWSLQAMNILLLFSEYSVSVVIEAGEIGGIWKQYVDWADSNRERNRASGQLSQIIAHVDAWISNLESELSSIKEKAEKAEVELTKIEFSMEEAQAETRELQTKLSLNREIAERMATKGVREQVVRQIEKLEGEELAHNRQIYRWARIGRALENNRVSVGNNRYLVFCGGKSGTEPGACQPFIMQKSQKQAVCPSCGRIHTQEELQSNLSKLYEEKST